MKGLLLTLTLLGQNPAPPPQPVPGPVLLRETIGDFPRSQLQPSVTGPISIDLNQSSRVSYETLAGLAGLSIIFDPDFRDVFTPFRIDKVDIVDALDRLSAQTGNFVEVLDRKTIMVAPNNQTKRREYETQVLKTIYLTNAKTQQDMTGIVTALRTVLNMRYIAISAARSAILIKDTPEGIASAERIIASLDRPTGNQPSVAAAGIPVDAGSESGGVIRSRAVRKLASDQSQLQFKAAGTVTINKIQDPRASYETLADMAGLNVIFDRDWRSPGPTPLQLQNVGMLDALDFLSLQTRSFWEVLDNKTILISPDNQSKRRDYDRTSLATIHLANVSTPREITEIITALRTLLNIRYLAQIPATNSIVLQETPGQIALAEKVIADLDRPAGNQTSVAAAAASLLDAGSETGGVLTSRAVRKLAPPQFQLQLKATGPLTVDMNEDARQSYERLAGMAGLRVTFDSRFQNGPIGSFKLKDVDVIDALDFLSLQTGNFWQVLDGTTIRVAADNQTTRRDLEPQIAKTIYLTRIQTPEGIVEVLTALRTLLNARQVEANANAIVMRDTPDRVALMEKLIADLDR